MLTTGLVMTALAFQVATASTSPPADPLLAAQSVIFDRERAELEAIADALVGDSRPEAALAVRGAVEPRRSPSGPSIFTPLPEFTRAAENPPTPLPAEAEAARDRAASALSDLARQAAAPDRGRFSLADDCLRGILRRRPDDPEARRLLGFVPYEGGWATPFAAEQLRKDYVLHETYGWVPSDWVEHLERGELPGIVVNGRPRRWLPADQADALRADFSKRPWEISTAHFAIRTDAPLSEAIAFGRHLEEFYELFFALMGDVIGPDRLPLAQRFADPEAGPSKPTKTHQVWYFASQEGYVGYLKPFLGAEVEAELGRYLPDGRIGRRSYFYNDRGGPISSIETLHHEVSHQLLFESVGASRYKRNTGNYWVWEGLGTYFETVESTADGRLEHGGLVGPRVELCRTAFLEGGVLVPTTKLTALDHDDYYDTSRVHSDPVGLIGPGGIARANLYYNQSMAFCIFLMQADGRRFREPFLRYVRAALDGKVNTTDRRLYDFLGVEPEAIDREFHDYLRVDDPAIVEPIDHSPT